MSHGETKTRQRNRGIRASRVKIATAMAKAGIKTQAALAARIAKLEGLDENDPPRRVVNKVMREQPVDMPTLMRVARALDVPVYSLYLTTEDLEHGSTSTGEPGEECSFGPEPAGGATEPLAPDGAAVQDAAVEVDAPSSAAEPVAPVIAVQHDVGPEVAPSSRWLRYGAWIAVALVLSLGALAVWRLPSLQGLVTKAEPERGGSLSVRLGNVQGHEPELFRQHLLDQRLDRVTIANDATNDRSSAGSLVLEGELTRVGRAVNVRLFSVDGTERMPFWSAIRSGPAATRELAHAAGAMLVQHALTGELPKSSNATATEQVMRGLAHLDNSPNELNLRRAQSELEAALRIDAEHPTAHAALCETLVRQSWIRDEQRSLSDAQNVCRTARELDEEAPLTRVAYAHLLERTGRAAESHLLLDEILLAHPDYTDALLTASDAALQAFLESGDARFLDAAERRARHSTRVEPDHWKTHWTLGRVEFHRKNIAAAIAAYETARRLDANEYVLGNLGAMRFCSGDVERARAVFLEARQTTDNPALGEEYMGMIHYYLRDFRQSIQHRQRAVDAMQATGGPEIHQIWGDLGDSLRRGGRDAEAARAYARALQIVTNDFSLGNATAGDKAYRAYYRVLVARSAGERATSAERASHLEDINDATASTTEAPALLRAALALKWLDEADRSRQVATLAGATCPVYAAHPDL